MANTARYKRCLLPVCAQILFVILCYGNVEPVNVVKGMSFQSMLLRDDDGTVLVGRHGGIIKLNSSNLQMIGQSKPLHISSKLMLLTSINHSYPAVVTCDNDKCRLVNAESMTTMNREHSDARLGNITVWMASYDEHMLMAYSLPDETSEIELVHFGENDRITFCLGQHISFIKSFQLEKFLFMFSVDISEHSAVSRLGFVNPVYISEGFRWLHSYLDMEISCGNFTVLRDVKIEQTGVFFVALFSSTTKTGSAVCIYNLERVKKRLATNIRSTCVSTKTFTRICEKEATATCLTDNSSIDTEILSEVPDPGFKKQFHGNDALVQPTPIIRDTFIDGSCIEVEVINNFTVVYIGTVDGQIFKMILAPTVSKPAHHWRDCSDSIVTPVLDINLTTDHHLLVLTRTQIAKLPVHNCDHHVTCDTCVEAPENAHCGWCLLDGRCAALSTCSNQQVLKCPVITSIAPDTITANDDIMNVTVTLDGDFSTIYPYCRLTSQEDKNINLSVQTHHVLPHDIQCVFSDIQHVKRSANKGNINLALGMSIAPSGPSVIESAIKYVDCQTFKSCRSCSDPAWRGLCQWCGQTTHCVSSSEKCHMTNQLVVMNQTLCPIISDFRSMDVVGDTVFISRENVNGYEIHAFGQNLPYPNSTTSYTCGLKGTELLPAQHYKDGYIKCTLSMVKTSNTQRTTFQVFFGNMEVPNLFGKDVEVYNCADLISPDNICRCASFQHYQPHYQCRICGYRCADNFTCDLEATKCPPPQIHKVYPLTSHLNSSVLVTIEGNNLGSHFNDTQHAVTIVGDPCEGQQGPGFVPSQSIVCKLTPRNVTKATEGEIEIRIPGQETVVFSSQFSFRVPIVTSINPKQGPESGGTIVTISGSYMDTGRNISVHIGEHDCHIQRHNSQIICQTIRHDSGKLDEPLYVKVEFDGSTVIGKDVTFTYRSDPEISFVQPRDSFESGGRHIIMTGKRLGLVQRPRIFVWFANRTKSKPLDCTKVSKGISCPSPPYYLDHSSKVGQWQEHTTPNCAWIGFIMDNVSSLLTPRSKTKLLYHPDPKLNSLSSRKIAYDKVIEIRGTNLTVAANITDVKVMIGSGHRAHICKLLTFESDRIAFYPPTKPPEDNNYRFPIMVHIGFYRQFVGMLEYEADTSYKAYIIIAVVIILIVVVSVVAVLLVKSHTMRRLKKQQDQLDLKMDLMEGKIRKQCRQEFAALQTAVSDLTGDLEGVKSLYREYDQYMEYLVFHEERNSRVSQSAKQSLTLTHSDEGICEFLKLLKEEKFLIAFARILEQQNSFSMRDRSNVATKIFLLNNGNIGYITRIIKTLLKDLVKRNISSNTTRLLMRRSDSICEKLLTHWLSVCMYHELKDQCGSALYILYKAIKIQVEKGPLDCITNCAKYSLSEDRLFIPSDQNFSQQEMTLDVTIDDPHQTGSQLQVSVVDCDTISQVKAKILEQFYKDVPFSKRPSVDNISLAVQAATECRLELSDVDKTNVMDGIWQKINTLKHYSLKSGMKFRLSVRDKTQETSVDVASLLQESSHAAALQKSESVTLWHLMKPYSSAADDDGLRLTSDIFLPRMLATKGMLQKYIDDLFTELFVVKDCVPLTVKYLLDFLDVLADSCNITDPDVIHSWKCNSLMLRFWVNIIKNPEFVFDIDKPVIVDSCLSVVAQTLMDSCSTSDLILGPHSPSNKLLFAKDIPRYRAMVQKFLKDVKEKPAITDEDFDTFLTDKVSGMFSCEQDQCANIRALIRYAVTYKDKIFDEFKSLETSDKDFQHFREQLENVLHMVPEN